MEAPLWAVDLGSERAIGGIVAYERRRPPDWNRRPLTLAISRDGRTCSPVPVTFAEGEGTLKAALVPAVTAGFLALQPGGGCRLSLDEVEVYPPEPIAPCLPSTPEADAPDEQRAHR